MAEDKILVASVASKPERGGKKLRGLPDACNNQFKVTSIIQEMCVCVSVCLSCMNVVAVAKNQELLSHAKTKTCLSSPIEHFSTTQVITTQKITVSALINLAGNPKALKRLVGCGMYAWICLLMLQTNSNTIDA